MATKKMGASGKAAPLEAKVANKLLDLLGSDNEFRRLFKKDPLSALKQAGYRASADGAAQAFAACLQVNRIAPKQEIVKSRAMLLDHLMGGLAQSPIHLNVETSAARRTRR